VQGGFCIASIGWTFGSVGYIGKRIHTDPCSIIIVFPKAEAARAFSDEKFVPAVRATGVLSGLIDTSGSMKNPDKLPLLTNALRLLVENLTEADRLAICTYTATNGVVLPPTPGHQRTKILAALDRINQDPPKHPKKGLGY